MNITEKSKNILFKIQQEIKEEDGVEMSLEEIADIVESQFLGLQFGIKKGLDVRLPFLGTFYRKFGKDAAKRIETINKLKETIDNKKIYQFRCGYSTFFESTYNGSNLLTLEFVCHIDHKNELIDSFQKDNAFLFVVFPQLGLVSCTAC